MGAMVVCDLGAPPNINVGRDFRAESRYYRGSWIRGGEPMPRLLHCAVILSAQLVLVQPVQAQFGFSPSAAVSSSVADVATKAIGISIGMVRGAEMQVDRSVALSVSGFALSPRSDRMALARPDGSVVVVDLIEGHRIAKWAPGEAGSGDGAALAAAARRGNEAAAANGFSLALVQGAVQINDRDGAMAARVVLASDGWAVVSQNGQFEAEGNGLDAVTWTAEDTKFSLEQFSDSHYEPGLLARMLAAAPLPVVTVQPAAAPEPAKPVTSPAPAATPAVVPQVAEAPKPVETPKPVEVLAPPPPPKVVVSKEFAMPPNAAIDGVKDGTSSDAEAFSLPYVVKGQGGGIEEVRLYQNGKLVWSEAPRTDDDVKGVIATKLAQGNNDFRLVALSRDRIESRPAKVKVAYTGAERKSTLHVVAVGINTYKNPSLNLNYGVTDARGIVDYFAKQPKTLYRDVVVHSLYDKDASKAAILDLLDSLKSTNPEDAVLIYLAGHGDTIGETWYFMPHEVRYPEREDEVRERGLSSGELNERIKDMGAQKVLMLVDACKSGAALVAFRGFEDRKSLMRVARASGVHVVAAAGKEQFAAEMVQLGHGLFTYTLLEGLSGKADAKKSNTISVRGLTNYVEDQLPEISQTYKGVAQFPVVDSRGMDFPLAVY